MILHACATLLRLRMAQQLHRTAPPLTCTLHTGSTRAEDVHRKTAISLNKLDLGGGVTKQHTVSPGRPSTRHSSHFFSVVFLLFGFFRTVFSYY